MTTTEDPGDTTTLELPDESNRRPFVVCGENPLAYRLIEELTTQYDGNVIAVVRPGINPWVQRMRDLNNVQIVTAELLDRGAFIAARLRHADALALVDQEDAANVEAALLAQEINPTLRIVIRMNKLSLGERISALLNNGVVRSASAIAAPAFVAAALDEAATPPILIAASAPDRTTCSPDSPSWVRAEPSPRCCLPTPTNGPISSWRGLSRRRRRGRRAHRITGCSCPSSSAVACARSSAYSSSCTPSEPRSSPSHKGHREPTGSMRRIRRSSPR